jgi:hypothetical protein
MASTHVYDETKALLQGQFSPTYQVLDFDQIETTLTRTGQNAFIALEEITETEAGNAFGDPSAICQRQEGVLVVHFFTPAPVATPGGQASSNTARSLAESVQDFMRYKTYSGIRIVLATPPDLEVLNSGLWTAAAIALSYQYDFFTAIP